MEISTFQKIKNEISMEQIKLLVKHYGAKVLDMTDEKFSCSTICHNHPEEDSSLKLYYYHQQQLFHCYTECGESFDIFELIIKIFKIQFNEEISLYEAQLKVMEFFSVVVDFNSSMKSLGYEDDLNLLEHYEYLLSEAPTIEEKTKVISSSILDNLSFIPPEPWLEEGLTIESMKKYGIKYYGTGHKVVIPHYDYNSNLVGLRARSLNLDDIETYGKYMPLIANGVMYNHKVSNHLYGLDKNRKNIKKAKTIIIFEGEKSVILYDSLFGERNNISVATCGRSLSNAQIKIIENLEDVEEIVFAYDKQFEELKDENCMKEVEFLTKLASKVNNQFKTSVLFDKWDKLKYKSAPIDNGKLVFEFLFTNRIVIGCE